MSTMSAAPEAAAPPMPLVSRIVGAATSPTAVFQNLRLYPRILGVLLVTLVVTLASYTLISPIINTEQLTKMTEAIEKNENIPEAQKTEIIDNQTRMMSKPIMKALGPLSILVFLPAFYALCALLFQVGCNFILGATVTFRQAFSGTLHAMIPPTIAGSLLKTPLILATKNLHAATSLALLLPEPDPATPLYGLLNAFDIFTIWTAVLIVIAGAGLTGLKTGRTRILGILFMVLAALGGVVGALLQGMGK